MSGPAKSGILRNLACAALLACLGLFAANLSPRMVAQAYAQTDADPTPVSDQAQTLPIEPVQAGQVRPETVKDDVRGILVQSGNFVQDTTFGEIWIPSVTPPGWHPYEPCHWINTRQYGWYYDDKTPWGQIVHHYGRWMHDEQIGWFWVPGKEFSPAWVFWRASPDWTGWAPMPPDAVVKTIAADAFNNGAFWTFIKTSQFSAGCEGANIAPRPQITVLLQETQFITQFQYSSGIGIIVLPPYVIGDFVDIDVTFNPWPVAFYTHVVINWTWMWNNVDVVVKFIFVNCAPPKPVILVAPASVAPPLSAPLFVPPPRPIFSPLPPPPPPRCADGAPRLANGACPVRVRQCPDGSTLPVNQACPVAVRQCPDGSTLAINLACPVPVIVCPRGTHPTALGCVRNAQPCPDGTVADQNGSCLAPPPPTCPRGTHLSRDGCIPDQTCQPGFVFGPDGCIRLPPPRCPDGSLRGPDGCAPPTCPRGQHPTRDGCAPDQGCLPGFVAGPDGCTRPPPSTCPDGLPRGPNGCAPPTCPRGQHPTRDGCAPDQVCLPGFVAGPDGCIRPQPPKCPDGSPRGPNGCAVAVPPICPDGSPRGPNGCVVRPPPQQLCPDGSPRGPNGCGLRPPPQQLCPDGSPRGPNGCVVRPPPQLLCPDGSPRGPNGCALRPPPQQLCPDGSPRGPNGCALRPPPQQLCPDGSPRGPRGCQHASQSNGQGRPGRQQFPDESGAPFRPGNHNPGGVFNPAEGAGANRRPPFLPRPGRDPGLGNANAGPLRGDPVFREPPPRFLPPRLLPPRLQPTNRLPSGDANGPDRLRIPNEPTYRRPPFNAGQGSRDIGGAAAGQAPIRAFPQRKPLPQEDNGGSFRIR